MRPLILASFVVAIAAWHSADAGAQDTLPSRAGTPDAQLGADPLAAADRLLGEDRPLDALDVLEAHLGGRPSDHGARWRAARASVILGILAPTEPAEERWLERGIEHAERAVADRPDDHDSLYWLVASRGWLAMVVGDARRTADLADDVYADVHRLLEIAPDHDGAHHALGKLHYEVMKLSRFERFLARYLLGVDVARVSSWERSVDHLARASALDPGMVLYHLDLGMTYLRAGEPEKARTALRAAVDLPDREVPDPLFKRRARALLSELDRTAEAGR